MDSNEQHAAEFAIALHQKAGHRRRYTDECYSVHLERVAALVRSVEHTPAMLQAAWLHDALEDTDCTRAMIEREFGVEVARLVEEVTDISRPQDGCRRTRKAIDTAHLALASSRAKTLKLADIIDNVSSIVIRDPRFARTYLQEKAEQLKVLSDGDPSLFQTAMASIRAATKALRGQPR